VHTICPLLAGGWWLIDCRWSTGVVVFWSRNVPYSSSICSCSLLSQHQAASKTLTGALKRIIFSSFTIITTSTTVTIIYQQYNYTVSVVADCNLSRHMVYVVHCVVWGPRKQRVQNILSMMTNMCSSVISHISEWHLIYSGGRLWGSHFN